MVNMLQPEEPVLGIEKENAVVGAERVLSVLISLADKPEGITLDEIARELNSAKPTIHRALVSLRKFGLAQQLTRGTYTLGDEFLRLAFLHHDRRPDTARIDPLLQELAKTFGETAHYAVLDGSEVVYRAKVDPTIGAMRLTSAIGGRNPAYRTAVGKALLAHALPDLESVVQWAGTTVLERKTPNTITTPVQLAAALEEVRERGFSTDDQENEIGVNCVAIPVYLGSPRVPSGAVSVSGLTYRTSLQSLIDSVPSIQDIIARHTGAPEG